MNRKMLLALSISLMFLLTPAALVAGATEEEKEYTVEMTLYSNGKEISTVSTMSKEDITSLFDLIKMIMKAIQSMNENITNITENISKILEQRFPLLGLLSSISGGGPLHDRVLIISNGYGKRINIKTDPKVSFFKFFTVWHYFGTKDYMIKSQTVIIDPVNAKIRLLTGWQLGIMKNFIGLYIKIRGSPLEKDHIFFMGFASKVTAFDLPDQTNFQ
ncbi:MAG: hypothetical protein FE042_02765 [Thermoplasmata archaeon]|nr:MAG: hypothetical protein FE042_02765 [Thermoplasmata archaeon]